MGSCAASMAEVNCTAWARLAVSIAVAALASRLWPASARSSQDKPPPARVPPRCVAVGRGVYVMAKGSTSCEVGVVVRELLGCLISGGSVVRHFPFSFLGQRRFSISGTFHVSGGSSQILHWLLFSWSNFIFKGDHSRSESQVFISGLLILVIWFLYILSFIVTINLKPERLLRLSGLMSCITRDFTISPASSEMPVCQRCSASSASGILGLQPLFQSLSAVVFHYILLMCAIKWSWV